MKNKLPSLYSCTGSIRPGYALFYGVNSNEPKKRIPIPVTENTVLGTISNYIEETKANSENELNPDTPNIQKIDSCYLPQDTDTLQVDASIIIRGTLHSPHACDNREFSDKLYKILAMEETKQLVKPLANRYIANILNGVWLFRNKYSVNKSFTIFLDDKEYIFPSINGFDVSSLSAEETENYLYISNRMFETLVSVDEVMTLRVVANVKLVQNAEVYPSQEFVVETKRGKEKKGKVLYSINSGVESRHAAMHSQKVGNGIRTIDDWIIPGVPLPINPYGQQRETMTAFRKGNTKRDLYSILQNLDAVQEQVLAGDPDNDVKFLIACLIRGGVYSGNKKKK